MRKSADNLRSICGRFIFECFAYAAKFQPHRMCNRFLIFACFQGHVRPNFSRIYNRCRRYDHYLVANAAVFEKKELICDYKMAANGCEKRPIICAAYAVVSQSNMRHFSSRICGNILVAYATVFPHAPFFAYAFRALRNMRI